RRLSGDAAGGAGDGNGFGDASAARHRGGGRARILAADHALRDAGGVHVSRSVESAARAEIGARQTEAGQRDGADRSGSAGGRACLSVEQPLGTLHRQERGYGFNGWQRGSNGSIVAALEIGTRGRRAFWLAGEAGARHG